jgi:Ca-activated chloride channel family protein
MTATLFLATACTPRDTGIPGTRPEPEPRSEDRTLMDQAAGNIHPASPTRSLAEKGGRALGYMAPEQAVDWNTEQYDPVDETGFREVRQNPLSTFSIDVDTASYANLRRFLSSGQRPPKDAIRIEECVNYFSYRYPQPQDGIPFSVNSELSACPWNTRHHLLLVALQGKEINAEKLPPSNLVFLIDVSGSMMPANKLPLLKSAFRLLANNLRPIDSVSIVVYAGASGVVLPPTAGDKKETIIAALEKLSAGGPTAGSAGIRLAYQTARDNFKKGGNNRIILASDGDFNVGTSSKAELVRMVEEERKHGVFLTILGFGMGNYKDATMEQLADKGNGNYAYIDTIHEARKVLVSQFGGTLFTIAKDVKIQVEFNPRHVKAYRLIGYENRRLNKEDFNNDKKDAGEMGAGHTVTALYEIVPADADTPLPTVDPLRYQEVRDRRDAAAGELATVKLRYKKPDSDTSRLLTHPVPATALSAGSENLRFAAAVSCFGMLLNDSAFKKDADWPLVRTLARGALGEDPEGYRAEFLRLAAIAAELPVR